MSFLPPARPGFLTPMVARAHAPVRFAQRAAFAPDMRISELAEKCLSEECSIDQVHDLILELQSARVPCRDPVPRRCAQRSQQLSMLCTSALERLRAQPRSEALRALTRV